MPSLTHTPRFMLLGLAERFATKEQTLSDFEELASLVTTYGGVVHAASVQNPTRGDNETYIGTGKAEELVEEITSEKIDVVVINAAIKPGQLYALEQIFIAGNPKIKVWDRVDLILAIFSRHAATAEAKLQIKLASMRHMGPRIYGMGHVLSQQGGGIGTRGIGETNVELMKRHWRSEMGEVRSQLTKINNSRRQQMDHRKRKNLPTVSIVGYTNAGKTTLFNLLCKKKHLVRDALFATLDSSVGTVYVPNLKQEVFVTDTIGFIRNLPTELIEAFKSTLMETIHADVLLHVIDAADPLLADKVAIVEGILRELEADTKPIMYVFNKSELISEARKKELAVIYGSFNPQFVSAKEDIGRTELVEAIGKIFALQGHALQH